MLRFLALPEKSAQRVRSLLQELADELGVVGANS
jgi:hypothetical protein